MCILYFKFNKNIYFVKRNHMFFESNSTQRSYFIFFGLFLECIYGFVFRLDRPAGIEKCIDIFNQGTNSSTTITNKWSSGSFPPV